MAESNKQYYEGKELDELIAKTDWPNLLPVLYAITRNIIFKRFLSDPDRGIQGKTFKDFTHEALQGFLEGRRKCPKDLKLEYFFMATIRNMISKHIGKHYNTLSVDATDEDILKEHYTSINATYDHVTLKNYVFKKLEKDDICKAIFECWTEGIDKPAEIRELHGYSEADFNNGKKRLTTILKDIRLHLKHER
jgi:hypothetical protein